MGLRATFEAECTRCHATETIKREQQPNERMPLGVLPSGWVQTKTDILCPGCVAEGAHG